jgi:hypothetical protein
MKFARHLICLSAALTTLMISSRAFAWGEVAHGILASTGAGLAQNGFFQANAKNFATLATVPDVVWKAGSDRTGESPNHWFQADYYFPSCSAADIDSFPKVYADAVNKYSSSTVLAQGTAPWRVKQFYDMAVEALKAGNTDAAMQYMGVMSHYIGDMSQPLHDSQNYDGAMTSSNGKATGIHAYFESSNISAANQSALQSAVQTRAATLLADPTFKVQFSGDIMDALYLEVARALAYRDQILDNDKNLGRTGQGAAAQLDLAESRMADGAATLALILDHLWADAGINSSLGAVTVSTPSWVAPDFTDLTPWVLVRYTPMSGSLLDDDCAK